VQGALTTLFWGYASGVAPLVSYNFGRQDRERLNKLFRKSLGVMAVLSGIALVATFVFADPLVRIYVSPNDPFMGHLHAMAMRGLRIAALSFILMGFNTFATSWFTAFNDGLISGLMSVMRTMVFALILLVTLPRVWDLDGVWVALPLAEVLAVVLTVFFLWKMGDKYMYRSKQPLK
jgi:Na+-driven multidrug efflux pump